MGSPSSRYSHREEIINAATHWLGTGLLATGGMYFFPDVSGLDLAAWIFYFAALLFMFCGSALYHSVKKEKTKLLCRKLDHCAIYFLITGTYAPLMTGLFPDWRGAATMTVLGVLTLAGVTIKFCCDTTFFHRIEVGIYLIMGWLCAILAKPLIAAMPRHGLLLLFYGGLCYSGGVIFYAIKKEFFHAAWHIFVLAGAILQFFAVLSLQ